MKSNLIYYLFGDFYFTINGILLQFPFPKTLDIVFYFEVR